MYDFYIIFKTVINVFKHEDIYEEKIDDSVDDVKAAEMAEEDIIRIAHLPDESTSKSSSVFNY